MHRVLQATSVGMFGALVMLLAFVHCNQPGTTSLSSTTPLPVPCIGVTASPASQTVPGGTVWTVTGFATQRASGLSATCPTGGDAGLGAGAPVDGLTLTFASTTTGVTVSPATNVTDATGKASSSVVVPFGTEVAVTVSGGGGENVALIPPPAAGAASPAVTLSPTHFRTTYTWLPGGELFELDVQATTGSSPEAGTIIEGFSVTFATTTTGVTFSPTTAMTDGTGTAKSYVAIPYGAEVQAVFSGGGVVNVDTATATTLMLAPYGGLVPTNTAVAGGEVYTFTVKATANDGDAGAAVQGVVLSFATTTSGVTFSPATVPTDSDGIAASSVIVPYGTQVEAVVSGGGSVTAFPAADAGVDGGITAPLVALSLQSFVPAQPAPVYLPTGQVYALTVSANALAAAGPGSAIQGLSVAFATTTTGVTFVPASVLTNSAGMATSNVIVPYGMPIQAVVSGGGAVTTIPSATEPDASVVGPVVSLHASLSLPEGGPEAGVDAALPCTLWAGAQINGVPLTGLPISLTVTDLQTGAGTSGSYSIAGPPSPIVTAADGGASYQFLIPANVVGFTALVSGGGSATSTLYPIGDN